jgi:hypothetical protein
MVEGAMTASERTSMAELQQAKDRALRRIARGLYPHHPVFWTITPMLGAVTIGSIVAPALWVWVIPANVIWGLWAFTLKRREKLLDRFRAEMLKELNSLWPDDPSDNLVGATWRAGWHGLSDKGTAEVDAAEERAYRTLGLLPPRLGGKRLLSP